MAKIGIFSLGSRRPGLWELHIKELAKCTYNDFHYYLLVDDIDENYASTITNTLKGKATVVSGFAKNAVNYLNKLGFAISKNHEYSIKHDEDAILTAEGWDRFFELTENLNDEDAFCTGAISNGIPTTELFIEHHIPSAKEKIYKIFTNTVLRNIGPDYSSLNVNEPNWDSDAFYERVTNFNHYYKGIHPVRVNIEAVKTINEEILKDFDAVMKPKQKNILKDNAKYPYFCNNIFGIKTNKWISILQTGELYVDNFDEVPINIFRNNTKQNLVIDVGIPIIHTMYNWTPDWEYENNLIQLFKQKLKHV